jgi:hypothetical protein
LGRVWSVILDVRLTVCGAEQNFITLSDQYSTAEGFLGGYICHICINVLDSFFWYGSGCGCPKKTTGGQQYPNSDMDYGKL